MKSIVFGNNSFNLREDVAGSPFVDLPVACFANSGVVRLVMGEIVKSGTEMEIAATVRFTMTMQTAAELAKVLTDVVKAQQTRAEAHN